MEFNLFSSSPQFEQGLYHKEAIDSTGYKNRIHLRVDHDGSGVLWVNANQTFYLNPTACLIVWCLIKNISDKQRAKIFARMFKAQACQAEQDFCAFSPALKGLLKGENHVCDLCLSGISSEKPFSAMPSAPYRMDLALTYHCNNRCSHCYNEKDRKLQEFSLAEWKKILKIISGIGIPHVVFTGGEPTTYDGLIDLCQEAEQLGLVTGINTNGRKLADMTFMAELQKAKVDHIQITLESENEQLHDEMVGCQGAWKQTVAGIQNAVHSGIFTMTNTTLLQSNTAKEKLRNLILFTAELGVKTIGINALIYSGQGKEVRTGLSESELPPLLIYAQQICDQNDLRLIWYTPTRYCHFDPQEHQLGLKGCSAARYAMCVEPNGDVLPCQSWYEPVGNLLRNNWQSIWNNPLCVKIRNKGFLPAECSHCEKKEVCMAGCPLSMGFLDGVRPIQTLPSCF